MNTYTAHNIEYVVDLNDLESGYPVLPDPLNIREVPDFDTAEALEDFLSEAITETTGFCHTGFSYSQR